MLMNEFKTLCAAQKVIPVLALDGSETSFRICQALVEGGLRLLEITLRTPEAWDIARRVKRGNPGQCWSASHRAHDGGHGKGRSFGLQFCGQSRNDGFHAGVSQGDGASLFARSVDAVGNPEGA